jgi:hypothetical protein
MLNFFRGRRRCSHGLEQCFLGDDYVSVSGFVGEGQSTFCDNFGRFVFYNGEDGLSSSHGRHVDLFWRGIHFNGMVFLQYFFGFLLSFFFSSSLFFIVQLVSIVDINLCIVESCHCCWKRLIHFPMSLQ